MTTPTGQISLSQVNTELGYSSTATISMNDAAVRTLAGVPSGAISMANLQGKSNRVAISYTFSGTTADAALNVSSIGGYNAGKSDITITVNSGVYLYATSTGNYGLNLSGATTGDTVTLVNNGYIMGMGGAGGNNFSPYNGKPAGPALNIGIGVNPTITNTSGYIAGGGGGGGFAQWSSGSAYGGGGAGGGKGGANSPSTGPGGGPGSAGGNGTVTEGGGGGRIVPGSGGAGAVANSNQAFGGGSGGGGGAATWPNETYGQGGAGGSAGSAGSAGNRFSQSKSAAAGGGGGWGASGGSGDGSSVSAPGGAGGKGVNLNGKTITWTGGPSSSSRVYGSVS